MPLIHSKRPAAFKKNIETEMEHGKPQKQAVAIAYHEADEAKRDHKARGGEMCAHGGRLHCNMGCYADGGSVDEPEMPPIPISGSGFRDMKKMADGGEMEMEEVHEEDDGLGDVLVDELMDAMERKDKRGVRDAIEALVMECMNKGGM